MKLNIVYASSDLGVNIEGSEKAKEKLNEITKNLENVYEVKKENVAKSYDKKDMEKNLAPLNKFNEKLYNKIVSLKDGVTLTIGGDHSIAIGSALASKKKNENIGIIWVDAHGDYNTFETTTTGNLHGMPFATVDGINGDRLSYFFDGKYFDPENSVLFGGRDIDEKEWDNLRRENIKIYSTEDLIKGNIENLVKEALGICTKGKDGVHVSIDVDLIDPHDAPGVSVKAKNGIKKELAFEILKCLLKEKNLIKSIDLVEFNKDKDKDDVTYEITKKMLEMIINEYKH